MNNHRKGENPFLERLQYRKLDNVQKYDPVNRRIEKRIKESNEIKDLIWGKLFLILVPEESVIPKQRMISIITGS